MASILYKKNFPINTVIVNRHHRLWTVSLLLENCEQVQYLSMRAAKPCATSCGPASTQRITTESVCIRLSVLLKIYSVNSPLCVRLCFLQRFWLELTGREYSWFATTWQGGYVGDQNNIFFSRVIYVKMSFSSQNREIEY